MVAESGLCTVRGMVEQAIRRTVRHQTELVGSGRICADVHAAGGRIRVVRRTRGGSNGWTLGVVHFSRGIISCVLVRGGMNRLTEYACIGLMAPRENFEMLP